MNNTFNLNRFGLILKRQWKEFGKIYLISLLVITGILVLFYTLNIRGIERQGDYKLSYPNNIISFRGPLFIILGFLFISIIASSYFAHFGQKPRAIIELMLPGSVAEKFVSGILFTALLPTISYLLIFHLTDLIYVNYYTNLLADTGNQYTPFLSLHQESYTYPFYVLPFLTSSLFLLGSIYFNRFHYIKTASSVMIFASLLGYVIYNVSSWLFDGKMRAPQGEGWLTSDQTLWLMITLLSVLTLVFWVIGYVRLKEKEV